MGGQKLLLTFYVKCKEKRRNKREKSEKLASIKEQHLNISRFRFNNLCKHLFAGQNIQQAGPKCWKIMVTGLLLQKVGNH